MNNPHQVPKFWTPHNLMGGAIVALVLTAAVWLGIFLFNGQ